MRTACGTQGATRQGRMHATSAHALYLHIPFCVRKCAYCDFASWETGRDDALVGAYVDALCRQLEELREIGLLADVGTAYVGGGTPTLLGAERLGRLVSQVREAAPPVRELTCEANPDSLADDVLDALVTTGATRLSIGVQSLVDAELEALGRVHDAQGARERVRAAVASGLDVSCDLMCAIPLQTEESWAQTLGQVVGLGVGHVSVYPLQLEEDTPLGRRWADEGPAWNDPSVQAERMEAASSVLESAGMARYEVASYARSGRECLHNQAYWTGVPYLGLGTGASSMLSSDAYRGLRSACPQLPELPKGTTRARLTVTTDRHGIAHDPSLEGLSFDLELLDEAQAVAEDLMLGLRMTAGIDRGLLCHARDVLGPRCLYEACQDVVSRGLAQWQDGRLVPTHDGWLLGNELYGTFWGLSKGEVATVHVTAGM